MSMTRWDPFFDLVSLPSLTNRIPWNGSNQTGFWNRWSNTYDFEMYDTPEAIIFKAALPGFKPEDISINVAGKVLTIYSQVSEQNDKPSFVGKFYRQFMLPVEVQSDQADAQYEYGVLTLTLPKVENARPHQITVRAGGGEANRLEPGNYQPDKQHQLAGSNN